MQKTSLIVSKTLSSKATTQMLLRLEEGVCDVWFSTAFRMALMQSWGLMLAFPVVMKQFRHLVDTLNRAIIYREHG